MIKRCQQNYLDPFMCFGRYIGGTERAGTPW